MDVIKQRGAEAGFTLIESAVAMGLFTGVAFLLMSVFGHFLLDRVPAETEIALAIAQRQISTMEIERDFSSSNEDTLGFQISRRAVLQGPVVQLCVTVASRIDTSKVYAELTTICQAQ